MKVSEVIKEVGLTKKAIFLYEEKGLLHPSKNASGYRVYTKQDVTILKQIKLLRSLQFSLSEVQEIIIHNNKNLFKAKKKEFEKKIYLLQDATQYLEEGVQLLEEETVTEILEEMSESEEFYEEEDLTQVLPFSIERIALYILSIYTGLTLQLVEETFPYYIAIPLMVGAGFAVILLANEILSAYLLAKCRTIWYRYFHK